MSSQKRRLAALFLWAGAVLIVVGIALSYARLVPYIETAFYSNEIPTAPPLELTTEATDEVLLPSGAGAEQGQSEGVAPPPTEAAVPPTVTTEPTEVAALAEVPATDTVQMPTEAPADTVAPTETPEPTVAPPTATPTPEPTPLPAGTLPQAMRIPAIELDAPVVAIGWTIEKIDGQNQAIWDVPDWRAAGWHNTSAMIGAQGNTVFNGHNTSRGEVFRDLYKVEPGAEVYVEGDDGTTYVYQVGEKYILREAGQPLSVRLENARYIQETPDERLTLVTCHPYGSLANRLVVIAYPVPESTALEGAE